MRGGRSGMKSIVVGDAKSRPEGGFWGGGGMAELLRRAASPRRRENWVRAARDRALRAQLTFGQPSFSLIRADLPERSRR